MSYVCVLLTRRKDDVLEQELHYEGADVMLQNL
jgi:hypothetical protein